MPTGKVVYRRRVLRWFLVSAGVLALAMGYRYGLLESGRLPLDCGGHLAEGIDGWCGVKWLTVQSFVHQRIGWLSLLLGIAATLVRRRLVAWAGWSTGLVGLVWYSYEPAAVGALLSLLVIFRRFGKYPQAAQQAQPRPA